MKKPLIYDASKIDERKSFCIEIGDTKLQNSDLMILRINKFSKSFDEFSMPYEITQYGLNDFVRSKSRGIVSLIVKPLISQGLVEKRDAHVAGFSRRITVYVLTMEGRKQAEILLKYLKNKGISEELIEAAIVSKRERSK